MKKQKISEAEQYKDRIYNWLDKLPEGVFELIKIVKAENKELFISVVKQYIDERGRGYNGFDMDFNSDFSKLHKFDLVL